MKVSLVRRYVALAALAIASLAAQAHAARLAFEALYDPDTGNISISPYDSDTDSPWIGDVLLGAYDFNSTSGAFTGSNPNVPPYDQFANPAQSVLLSNSDQRQSMAFVNFSVTVSVANPFNVGNVAQTGLSQAFIDTDFSSEPAGQGVLGSFTWSVTGVGNGTGPVTSIAPVPEPSTIMTLAIGGIAGLGYTARRRFRKKAA